MLFARIWTYLLKTDGSEMPDPINSSEPLHKRTDSRFLRAFGVPARASNRAPASNDAPRDVVDLVRDELPAVPGEPVSPLECSEVPALSVCSMECEGPSRKRGGEDEGELDDELRQYT